MRRTVVCHSRGACPSPHHLGLDQGVAAPSAGMAREETDHYRVNARRSRMPYIEVENGLFIDEEAAIALEEAAGISPAVGPRARPGQVGILPA